jgi:hypothetical protein
VAAGAAAREAGPDEPGGAHLEFLLAFEFYIRLAKQRVAAASGARRGPLAPRAPTVQLDNSTSLMITRPEPDR